MTTKVCVLLSGSGTLCQALLDAIADGEVDAEVVAVVSDQADAYGLERARQRGIPAIAHPLPRGGDRARWDRELTELVAGFEPDLVASPASLAGRSVPLLAADQEEAEAIARKVNALATSTPLHEPVRLERSITPAQGAPFPAEIIFSSHMDMGHRVILAQIRDLSERKKAEEERQQQANTDQLTGLANRHFLEQQLDALLGASRHQGTYCAVLLIDLDHFKKVNDTLGHTFGDQVLRETALALLAHL